MAKNRKYSEQDIREDLSKLELLLWSLEVPAVRRKLYLSDLTDEDKIAMAEDDFGEEGFAIKRKKVKDNFIKQDEINKNTNSKKSISEKSANDEDNSTENNIINDEISSTVTSMSTSTSTSTSISVSASVSTSTSVSTSVPLLQLSLKDTVNKANLIWLNHNLTISNKRNVKLIETLKLIQRILKKL